MFRCLADAEEIYISRVVPNTTPAMNEPPSASNFQELVMEMCSDLFHTDRMVIGDRLHSAIDTVEMLYEKKLTESKQ